MLTSTMLTKDCSSWIPVCQSIVRNNSGGTAVYGSQNLAIQDDHLRKVPYNPVAVAPAGLPQVHECGFVMCSKRFP
jgi:hypothetical protein